MAILLALPVASATWFARGTYEPDTLCDTADGCTTPGGVVVAGGYMYQNPDAGADGLKVYFNGYITSGAQAATVNPNNELLGTRFTSSKFIDAYLGIWKDCDNDGYIGSGFGALHYYKTDAVSVDLTACPDGSIFNKNGWVYEFIWIGNGAHADGMPDDRRWINDTETQVWIDFGQPGTSAAPTCPIQPWPSGSSGSTGGLLMNFDCFTSYRGTNTVNSVDSDGGLGLRFEDPSRPQESSSLLNQDFIVHPWNDPYGGANNDENDTGFWDENSQQNWNDADQTDEDTAFHVWDCSQPEATVVTSPANEDPTGGEIREDGTLFGEDATVVELAGVSPGVDDPVGGSYYDSVNATERGSQSALNGGGSGLTSADGEAKNNCDREVTNPGGCDDTTRTATWCFAGIENFGVAGTERDFLASGFGARRESSDVMNFALGNQPARGRCDVFVDASGSNCNLEVPSDPTDEESPALVAFNYEDELKNQTGSDTGDVKNTTLGEGYQYGSEFSGVLPLRPSWGGQINWIRANNMVLISTDTLAPHSAQWLTYYAKIGGATVSFGAVTPKNNVASVYGDEWCHGATTGVSTNPPGLDCDRTHWWNPEFGATGMFTANGFDLGAKVGDPYHLRDIDCYDSTVARGTNVRASLVDVSAEGPCVDAP